MPRFYVDLKSAREGTLTLNEKESHHAIKVLRLRRGDALDLLDGKGNCFQGVVLDTQGGRLKVMLGRARSTAGSPLVEISLAVAVVKPECMELVVQKSCELGAGEILPLISERSVVRLSKERWDAKIERWNKIALESCKQCGRSQAPNVAAVRNFKSFISSAGKSYDKILIPTLARAGGSLGSVLAGVPVKKILVLIGPEGDFTPAETDLALSCGALPVTLGSLVMRSETAAIYMMSVLNFFYGEIRKKGESA